MPDARIETNMLLSTHQIEVYFEKGSLDNIQEGTKLLAVLDEDWPDFLREERCMARDRLNRWIVPLDEGGRGVDYDGYFRTSIRQVVRYPCIRAR